MKSKLLIFLSLLLSTNLLSFWQTPKNFISSKEILKLTPIAVHKIHFDSDPNISLKKSFIIEFDNARIFEDGILITNDNKVFKDVIVKSHDVLLKDHHIFHERDDVVTKQVKGIVALIASPGEECYYHWLLQILPRFELLRKSNVRYDYIYLMPFNQKFQIESLNLLGIDQNKIIFGANNQQVIADKIIVPAIAINNEADLPIWVTNFLKREILEKCFSDLNFKRIFISRKKAKMRKIINEDEIIKFLKNHDFEIICMEDYNLPEQAKIMNSAEIIIAPHGSGFANLVYCKSNTKIIEIFNFQGFTQPFQKIASKLGLQHFCFFTDDKNLNSEQKKLALNCDIYIDCKKFKNFVLKIIE